MKRLVFKSTLFSAIALFLILLMDNLYTDVQTTGIDGFYKLENGLDIVFLGNSHIRTGVIPEIINAKSKTKSYNMGSAAENIYQVYYDLLEVLKYKKPKLVVIENFCFLWPSISPDFKNEEGIMNTKDNISFYKKRIGVNKVKEASQLFKKEDIIYNLFNTFRYHDDWSDLEKKSNIIYNRLKEDEILDSNYNSGVEMTYLPYSLAEEYTETKQFNNDSIYISKDQEIFIERIIALSKKHNFKLLFMTLPLLNEYYLLEKEKYKRANNHLLEIIQPHDGVDFLDLNGHFNMGLPHDYFKNEKRITSNQHLNYKGAILATNFIGDYINERYVLNKDQNYTAKKIEDVIYNLDKAILDTSYIAGVSFINGKRVNDEKNKHISIAQGEQISMTGWNFHINHEPYKRYIALKKDETFIYIGLRNQILKKESKGWERKYGKNASNGNFEFKMSSWFLEKGDYRIFIGMENLSGQFYTKESGKIITVE